MPDDDTPASTTNHLFDNPELNALEFLAAVMHSPEADINDRIAAASALLPFISPKPAPTVRPWYVNGVPSDVDCTIKIVVGGLPDHASVAVEQDEGSSLINPCPIRTN
jgi:hypothetical protein